MYCTINCERASSLLFLKPDASRHPIHAARWQGWLRRGASAVAAYFDPLSLYFITPECELPGKSWGSVATMLFRGPEFKSSSNSYLVDKLIVKGPRHY